MNLYEKLNRLDDSLVESKRVVKKKKLTESVEESKLNMKDGIEEIVFTEFETGHLFADDYESFKSLMRDEGLRATPRAYSYYQELHELGPAGFYEEFKDKFEFDPMFINEYANIDDNIDETDYIESVKGFKLFDNVVTETGHKGFIIKFLYTDQDDPVAEIMRGWMDSSPVRSYVSKLKHVDSIDEMLTENTLTTYLPPSVDNMLMDMAQMCGEFDYSDVYKFVKAGVDDDTVRRLKNLYRRWNRAAEYNDEEKMCILAKETAQIIGKYELTESKVLEGTLDKIKAIIDKTESVRYTTSVTANGIDVQFTDGSILTAIKNLKKAGFKVYNVGREFDGIVRIVDIPEPTHTQLKMTV